MARRTVLVVNGTPVYSPLQTFRRKQCIENAKARSIKTNCTNKIHTEHSQQETFGQSSSLKILKWLKWEWFTYQFWVFFERKGV